MCLTLEHLVWMSRMYGGGVCVYLYITHIFVNGWDQKWTFQIPDPVFISLLCVFVCIFRKDAAKVWKNAGHQICFCQTALNLGWPSVGNSIERKTEGICFIKPLTKKCGLKACSVSGISLNQNNFCVVLMSRACRRVWATTQFFLNYYYYFF